MRLWPWESPDKKLEDILKSADLSSGKRYTAEEFWLELRSMKRPPFYKRWYYSISNSLCDFSWYLYRLYKPCNDKIRKCIPRSYCDSTELILILNFNVITQFYEDEYSKGIVEFDGEFEKWLVSAYNYITSERGIQKNGIEAQLNELFELSPVARNYTLVHNMEAELDRRDEEVLISLMKYRAHFWT